MTRKDRRKAACCFVRVGILLLSMVLLGVSRNETIQISAKNKAEFQMKVTYGLAGTVKHGRFANVHCEVTTELETFQGYLQVIIPIGSGASNEMYQKEIILSRQVTKSINIVVPTDGFYKTYKVCIQDQDGNIMYSHEYEIQMISGTKAVFMGIISDEYESMDQLCQGEMEQFPLEISKFPEEERGLSALDIIYMEKFDLDQLSHKMCSIIVEWVEDGGTLVLGLDCKNENGYFENYLINGKVVGDVWDEDLFYRFDVKSGTILRCIDREDFNVSDSNEEFVTVFLEGILDNLSQIKKNQLRNEDYDITSEDMYFVNSLNTVKKEYMPKLVVFMGVYLIYIVCIGPVLYLVLNRRDKKRMMWIMVYVLSVFFTGIIYLMSTKTRISQPILDFISIYEYSLGDDTVKEDTFIRFLQPFQGKTEYTIDGDYQVTSRDDVFNYYYEPVELDSDAFYKTGITLGEGTTTVDINSTGRFQSNFIKASTVHNMEGEISCQLFYKNLNLSGTITNNLGYNLTNVCLYTNLTVVNIGDFFDGTSVDIADKNKYFPFVERTAPYDNTGGIDVFEEISGGSPYVLTQDAEAVQRYTVLENYVFDRRIESDGLLIGFMKVDKKLGFMGDEQTTRSGIQAVIIPLKQVEATYQGERIIPDIEKYLNDLEGECYPFGNYMESDQVLAEYQFPSDVKVSSILYLEELNQMQNGDDDLQFQGTISAWNWKLQEYVNLYQNGEVLSLEDIEDYFDAENKVYLYYQLDNTVDNSLATLPIISATCEVK
ncbi:hypothetical protein [Anaeromicropila populeti]|uniref:Uncharacterized protein n=1 Tax=Anaeromicropila populeti TaxID=37658 RepID=A0A1I6HRC6_9FIRM|nr:hypothetical protein [Anaeromicropila populeti]SFR56999.1 hypothetical protein SAMN05661086_00190 [Anaeromicropila populeti]